MKKTKKKSNKNIVTKVSEQDYAPDYITFNGHRYERMSDNSVDFPVDLKLDQIDAIDDLISSGKYVSRGDALRSILRQHIMELENKK